MIFTSRKKKVGKVLVADDDPTMRQMVEILLHRKGIEYRSVADGSDAVKAWEEEDFSLILMDVQMPEMDGLEATRLIREKEEGTDRHTPIVAITAYAIPGDDARCRAAGMDDYLTKPIDFPNFYSIVEEYGSRNSRGSGENGGSAASPPLQRQ